jgi:hypothetical protein
MQTTEKKSIIQDRKENTEAEVQGIEKAKKIFLEIINRLDGSENTHSPVCSLRSFIKDEKNDIDFYGLFSERGDVEKIYVSTIKLIFKVYGKMEALLYLYTIGSEDMDSDVIAKNILIEAGGIVAIFDLILRDIKARDTSFDLEIDKDRETLKNTLLELGEKGNLSSQ